MPRGNDSYNAAAELSKKLGVELNAQEIIDASRAQYPQELRAASNKGLNEEATEALDEAAVKKTAEALAPDKATLVPGAYSVRGDQVVALLQRDDLRTYKVAFNLDEVGGVPAVAKKRAPAKRSRAKAS